MEFFAESLFCLVCHLLFGINGQEAGCTANDYDAIDLAFDNNYYFFNGTIVHTVSKLSLDSQAPVPISGLFQNITTPVIAAFSTGPFNTKMFLVDSDPVDNLKIYKVSTNDTVPRAPLDVTSLDAIFPSASSRIPSPLTAVLSAVAPARVYLMGGPAQNRSVAVYSYSSTSVFTVYDLPADTLSDQWNVDVNAATMYYNPSTGNLKNLLFSGSETAEVDSALNVTAQAASNTCPDFQPDFFSPCCDIATTTVAAFTGSTTVPPPPVIQCSTSPDAVELAPDNKYYFFYGYYLTTTDKNMNSTSPALVRTQFSDLVPPVIASFTIGPNNAKLVIIDSSTKNNVKMYAFNATTPRPLSPSKSGTLATFFPSWHSIPQPITAVMAPHTPARVYFFGGQPTSSFIYSFNSVTTTFAAIGRGITTSWPLNVSAAAVYTYPNNNTAVLYVFDDASVAKVDFNLNIVQSPQPTASCSFPAILSPSCCVP